MSGPVFPCRQVEHQPSRRRANSDWPSPSSNPGQRHRLAAGRPHTASCPVPARSPHASHRPTWHPHAPAGPDLPDNSGRVPPITFAGLAAPTGQAQVLALAKPHSTTHDLARPGFPQRHAQARTTGYADVAPHPGQPPPDKSRSRRVGSQIAPSHPQPERQFSPGSPLVAPALAIPCRLAEPYRALAECAPTCQAYSCHASPHALAD